MILGTGIDILEIKRIKNIKISFRDRIFTENERRQARGNASRLAGDFAAKEAFVKAIGTGFSKGIKTLDIEVLRKDTGAPYIKLYNKALEEFERIGGRNIHLSISNTAKYVAASLIIEGE